MRWVALLILLMNMTASFAGVKAVLFDCDGTLVDTEYGHYLGLKLALNELGSDLTFDDYSQCVDVGNPGGTSAQLIAEKSGIDCTDFLLERKREHYVRLCKAGFPPLIQTVNFLKTLASEKESLGIKIGVCSAANKEEIFAHLKHLQIEHLLDMVLSGSDDLDDYTDPEGVNKPKPYIYLHAMKLLGVAPEETVVIEDSRAGSLAGVSAGCFTIAIPNDHTRHHDFSHSHWQLDSFAELDIQSFFQTIVKMKANPKF